MIMSILFILIHESYLLIIYKSFDLFTKHQVLKNE
jgi:hypothetical protein